MGKSDGVLRPLPKTEPTPPKGADIFFLVGLPQGDMGIDHVESHHESSPRN